ncbi:hypothetical protein AgCh_012786 [Apium graveolens]
MLFLVLQEKRSVRFEALELEFCNQAVIALSTHLNNRFSILFQICQRKKRRLDKLRMMLLKAQSLMIFTHWEPSFFELGNDEVNNSTLPLEEALDDSTRVDYYNQHISFVQQAIRKNKINDAVTWNIVLSGFLGSRIHDTNRAMAVDEIWRIRQKEQELDDRLKRRQRDRNSSDRSFREQEVDDRLKRKWTDESSSDICYSDYDIEDRLKIRRSDESRSVKSHKDKRHAYDEKSSRRSN